LSHNRIVQKRRTSRGQIEPGRNNPTSAFVWAAGMADDTAVAWLDAVLPSWRQTWRKRGADVLQEVSRSGHENIAERLIQLFGQPAP